MIDYKGLWEAGKELLMELGIEEEYTESHVAAGYILCRLNELESNFTEAAKHK